MEQEVYIPIITAIISSGISYYVATVVHKFDKKYKRKEKSLEMANEFSKLISSKSFDIGGINKQVLENLGMQNKITELENKKYLYFDYNELLSVFTEDDLKRYREYKKIKNVEFVKILFDTFRDGTFIDECIRSSIVDFDNHKTLDENLKKEKWVYTTGEKTVTIGSNDILQAINSMSKKYNETAIYGINKLEWLAMYFTNNIADSSTVYQSLYQVYLKTVISQYIDVSQRNKNGHEKFYVNLIELYNEWSSKKRKYEKKSEKLKKANSNIYQKTKRLK